MKSKQVYKLAKEIWFPELELRGFVEGNGRYLRSLDSGVVHLIGVGKDPHGAESFRVMCGVDAIQLKDFTEDSYGYSKKDDLYHLTPKGWDYNSGRWPCETEEEARASLSALRSLILDLAMPYFAPIATLSDVGDEINETRMPHLGWMKARLYMLDGDIPRAQEAIEQYAAYAALPRPWISQAHRDEEIERAERMRREMEAAVSKTNG